MEVAQQHRENRPAFRNIVGRYTPYVQIARLAWRNRETISQTMRNVGRTAKAAYNRYRRSAQSSRIKDYIGSFGGGGGRRPRIYRRKRGGSCRGRKTGRRRGKTGFVRRVKSVINASTPFRSEAFRSFEKIIGAADTSHLWGADLHIGSANVTMSPPPPGLKSAKGDIVSFFEDNWAVSPPFPNQYASVDYNKLNFVMRNQGNFGCYLKVYLCRTPVSFTNANAETIKEIISTNGWQGYANNWTSNNDLTEIIGINRYIKIVRRYNTQLLPGETKKFHLRVPKMKSFNLQNHTFQTRSKWTRTIIFQFTGFPLHDRTNELDIASSPVNIDCQMMHRMKGRIIHNTENTYSVGAKDVSDLGNLGGQQIQTGLPNTLFNG